MSEPQGKYWCYTWFETEEDPHESLMNAKKKVVFHVYQLESCPETDNWHYQGYVCFGTNVRFSSLKKVSNTAHWTLREKTHDACVKYCTKEDTRVPGFECFLFGDWKTEQGKRCDLLEIRDEIMDGVSERDIMENHFATWCRNYRALGLARKMFTAKKRNWITEVYIYWGAPGTGKSRLCHDTYPDAYWKGGDSEGGAKWWDDYNGQEVVICDDYRGWFSQSYLLRLCDRYPMKVETKGGHVDFLAEKVIFTSNLHPKDWNGFLEWDPIINPFIRRITLLQEFGKNGEIKKEIDKRSSLLE